MNEQNDTPSEQPTGAKQDAIDINDFVFAATGARVRRLTLPSGEHWFPAVDVGVHLGYVNTRQGVHWHVAADCERSLGDLVRTVYGTETSRNIAGHGLKKSMRMVNLRGLIQLVNGCTKPECAPFKEWVSEVIETIQRDGSYVLDPAPVQPSPDGTTAYLMPQQVADAIVRLEERNIRADEELAVARIERIEQMRRTNEHLGRITDQLGLTNEHLGRVSDHLGRTNDHLGRVNDRLGTLADRVGGVHDVLGRLADSLDVIADRLRPAGPARSAVTPQRLLATWRAKNLVVTEDVHAVAAYLAPALVHGPVHCRLEEVADRTGLTLDRVHDCVRMLLKRGCMRQAGVGAGGLPVYVLP
ncbi:DNA-binding protein [Streptomyces corchorusii]|uniref:DNA-binding protein n=2 Tax=Streptomyces TaxID=1883 RepID=A0A117QGL2_STRCK|nr:Bro-N domain-containing protein [Streptomyces corchorusii]KUN27161.1 DNA-binding protein [Streptomyces corchorusii]